MLLWGRKEPSCDYSHFSLYFACQQETWGEFVEVLIHFPYEERNVLRRIRDRDGGRGLMLLCWVAFVRS